MSQNPRARILFPMVLLLLTTLTGCPDPTRNNLIIPEEPPKGTDWTILCYIDADNDLEEYLMADIAEMQAGIEAAGMNEVNVIVLVDRIDGEYSGNGILYADFTDARLFRLTSLGAVPLDGGDYFPGIAPGTGAELNMGDAQTLKTFIEYGKANYPATHYALIFSNHGGGARSALPLTRTEASRAVCWDYSAGGDCLYTAELTDVLDADDSVDLLVYDACLMGAAEVAYQYRCDPDGTFAEGRFSALFMAASAPNVWGWGLPYDNIICRLAAGGGTGSGTNAVMAGGTGTEQLFDPDTLTPAELGQIIVEEQYDDTSSASNQSFALYDLSRMGALKTALDALAAALAPHEADFKTAVFGTLQSDPEALAWFNPSSAREWVDYPFFDSYSVVTLVQAGILDCASPAAAVLTALDAVVVCSFAQSDFWSGSLADFNGRYGLSLFCPEGDRVEIFFDNGVLNTFPSWSHQRWYHPSDTTALFGATYIYGKLSWCGEGATEGNGTVENWFELLDSWYDDTSGGAEGTNGYAP